MDTKALSKKRERMLGEVLYFRLGGNGKRKKVEIYV